MKIITLILTCILMLMLMSCEKDGQFIRTHESEEGFSYKESLDAWNVMKSNNSNSYTYESNTSSVFGFGSVTKITVVDGRVTERAYQEYVLDDQLQISNTDVSYLEVEDRIGTNQNGMPAVTIDELYDSCVNELLVVNANENLIYFETESNGLMNLCGFFPKNCADDCFTGIQISSFEFL